MTIDKALGNYRIFFLFIIFLFIANCSGSSGSSNSNGKNNAGNNGGGDFVSIAGIDTSTDDHVTTRQFQRKVFYINGRWFVFYSNGSDAYYASSADGLIWSMGVIQSGLPHSSSIDVINTEINTVNYFYFFYSSSSNSILNAREDVINNQAITLGTPYSIYPDTETDELIFYSSASLDPDNFFWIASRHKLASEEYYDVIVSRSNNPLDIMNWTPKGVALNNTDTLSMAPQIIGLGGGKAYLAAKATAKGLILGRLYDGQQWSGTDSVLGLSSKVAGDDRRMSMIFESGTGDLHLVYIDNNSHLRYRVLSPPYGENNWQPPLEQPGNLVVKDSQGQALETYTCVLAMDESVVPANIYLLYGGTKYKGSSPAALAGELRLLRYANAKWSSRSLLMSEEGKIYNRYPSLIKSADQKIGVLYLKGLSAPYEIMFSSADISDIENYFASR